MDTQTKNQNCQSDEATPPRYGFDCLPREIVLDIASRLPITSLLQFTFVRKSFYNLSHDPEMVNLHLSRAVKNDPCIIINAIDHLYFVEFSDHGMENVVRKISTPFADSMPAFIVVDSCQGLLCIWDHLISDFRYVYNPFTRDWKELSKSITYWGQSFVLGFGFSPTTNEYKVIIQCDPQNHNKLDVEVFSLGSNRRRSIIEVVYQIDPNSQGIMLNGKMHWLTIFGMYYGGCDRLIVSFDLADEVFGEVPKVDFGVDTSIVKFQLAVLGDYFAVALTFPHENGGRLEIWVMREYNVKESWVKEFIIGTYTPIPNSERVYVQILVKVVCLLKNGNLLLEYKLFPLSGLYLVSYEPHSGVFRPVVHVGCLNWIDIPPADLSPKSDH